MIATSHRLSLVLLDQEALRHPDEELIEKIADRTDMPIAAVYESRYTDKEDAFAYEVAEAIRTGYQAE